MFALAGAMNWRELLGAPVGDLFGNLLLRFAFSAYAQTPRRYDQWIRGFGWRR